MGSTASKKCSCIRRRRRSTAYEEETSSSRSIEIDIQQQSERPLRANARKTKSKCFSHMIPKKILCCLQKDDMSMTKIERSKCWLGCSLCGKTRGEMLKNARLLNLAQQWVITRKLYMNHIFTEIHKIWRCSKTFIPSTWIRNTNLHSNIKSIEA